MNKELRALNRIRDFMSENARHWKQDIWIIEPALKALEIIKEKRVDIATLMDCLNVEEYNRWVPIRSHYSYRPFELTEEEYDLLEEVLL